MANWIERKSKKGNCGYRQTTTINYGKGITNSSGFGSKAGRVTFSTGPKGTKIYTTVRSGNMYQRTSKTISRPYKARKPRKLTKKQAAQLMNPTFWAVMGIVLLILMVV